MPTPNPTARYAITFAADLEPSAIAASTLTAYDIEQLAYDVGFTAHMRNERAGHEGRDFWPVAFVEQAAAEFNRNPSSTFDNLLRAGQAECDSLARRMPEPVHGLAMQINAIYGMAASAGAFHLIEQIDRVRDDVAAVLANANLCTTTDFITVANTIPDSEKFRREGIDAHGAGTPRTGNPYSFEASRAWDSGWLQAAQAAAETATQ